MNQWVCINTLRPRQNGRHFADNIFKGIFLNENVWILINISLKFVPKGPIDHIPSLVQIMAWHHPGNKLLSEPMMVILLTHICVTRPQWVNRLLVTNRCCWFFFVQCTHHYSYDNCKTSFLNIVQTWMYTKHEKNAYDSVYCNSLANYFHQWSWGGILVSFCLFVCPSVSPSICTPNHVCSVSSTILARSISYLHILSTNFRRCVTCRVWRKCKIWMFANFFYSMT